MSTYEQRLGRLIRARPCMGCGRPLGDRPYVAYRWERFHVECFQALYPKRKVKVIA